MSCLTKTNKEGDEHPSMLANKRDVAAEVARRKHTIL